MDGILSIQSQVVYGHVGNAAAQFALQRMGFEVWAVPTVLFSNHPGHGGFKGKAVPAEDMAALVAGLDGQGFLKQAQALLTGYLGHETHVEVVCSAATRIRAQSPHAPYCCDPVIGERETGAYVKPGVADALRARLVPLADILTPNCFELEVLSERTVDAPGTALAAARALARPLVICTSVAIPADPAKIGTLAVTADQAWLCVTDRLAQPPSGTGDLFTALFLGHLLKGVTVPHALQKAASAVDRVLTDFGATGEPDMRLIAAQDAIAQAAEHPHLTAGSFDP